MTKYKYFFGWRSTLGTVYPVRWIEEQEVPIGGKFDVLEKHPITRDEYLGKTSDLEAKYPLQQVEEKSK